MQGPLDLRRSVLLKAAQRHGSQEDPTEPLIPPPPDPSPRPAPAPAQNWVDETLAQLPVINAQLEQTGTELESEIHVPDIPDRKQTPSWHDHYATMAGPEALDLAASLRDGKHEHALGADDGKKTVSLQTLPGAHRRKTHPTVHYSAKTLSKSCQSIANAVVGSLHRWTPSRQRAIYSRRLVHKNGDYNIDFSKKAQMRKHFLNDVFTTMVEANWRWSIGALSAAFLLSWTIFAGLYYGALILHGDFQHTDDEKWKPCIANIEPYSFAALFLFSLETQHSIGYGFRSITTECLIAQYLMVSQCIFSIIIHALMVGIVFAKLATPKRRAGSILWSRNAVICRRDGDLCLLMRLADMRETFLMNAHVTLSLFKRRDTPEGENIPLMRYQLRVGQHGNKDSLLIIWPITITHVIDKNSPLYHVDADSLIYEKFEIIAMLDASNESTGATLQARTSYLPCEILWGRRFVQLDMTIKDNGELHVDYSHFDKTYAVKTPTCSAKQLDENVNSEPSYYHGPRKDTVITKRLLKYPKKKLTRTSSDYLEQRIRKATVKLRQQQFATAMGSKARKGAGGTIKRVRSEKSLREMAASQVDEGPWITAVARDRSNSLFLI